MSRGYVPVRRRRHGGADRLLTPWASADGKLYANLADPQVRAKIREEILHPTSELGEPG